MPGGRPKKTNKLSDAERARRSRKKRKQEDPDGFKKKSAVHRKRHYDKNKSSTQFRFQAQKSALLKYYRKEQKKKPYLKIITLSKEKDENWGVEVNLNQMGKYRIIKPSITQTCIIPGLIHPHYILWMITKKEKYAGRKLESYLIFQKMLNENQITMVLSPVKIKRIPDANTTVILNKDYRDIVLFGDENRVILKHPHDDSQDIIHIVGMSHIGGEPKNWWFVSNDAQKDIEKIRKFLSSDRKIYIYGNPVKETVLESCSIIPECIDDSNVEEVSKSNADMEDADVCTELDLAEDQVDDNINFEEEFKFKEEFVPLEGTDILNIPENLQKLTMPCYCFYNKPLEADKLQSRAEMYKILKVVKNVDSACQVKFTYSEWKEQYEQYVDVKDVEILQHLGWSKRKRKSVARYNPEEENIKDQKEKAVLKSVQEHNEKLEKDIDAARKTCDHIFTQTTDFGSLMNTIKDCTITNSTSSATSGVWKKLIPNDILVDFLRSTIPKAYVDITYDFFLNILPKGILTLPNSRGEVLGSSYSRCVKVGTKMIEVVSLNILIVCLNIYCA